ncbi:MULTISPECIES: HipA domain-containing protein [Colwellia]|uniref:Toxin-antitoxin system toxin HipA family protein n=1 Tax=Colwellia marinimaniae TaxID=1513592 RepID=A0ABQ0MT50_9GAMM|nr:MULTISPECIES: HipA domain-containing protein [Colwellia]GAW95551.1 toxin-antitoxin system toxin HipA family protein [Colwellia marinimaniae]
MNLGCKGSLKLTLEKNLQQGFSTAHLKSMYGLTKPVTVKGTSESFNDMVIDHTQGMSISGVQRKMFMTLEKGILVPSNQGEYIVKPTPKDFSQLSENEHAIMKIAARLGFKVAKCSIAPFEDGELVYVTKRFDLTSKKGVKIFVEDGASICDVHPMNKGSDALSYERCIKTMVDACGGAIALSVYATRLVLFSYIVGNNDLHLKNFSLQRKPTSKSPMMDGFTPLYDVLSVAPYPKYDTEYLSLSLLESETDGVFSSRYEIYSDYTKHDFILLLTSLGVDSIIAEQVILDFVARIRKVSPNVLTLSSLSGDMQDTIMNRIIERCKVMERKIIE